MGVEEANRFKRKVFAAIKGFLVIALGLSLISLVVPRLGGRKNAKGMAAGFDISNIATAVGSFRSDCGRYPTTAEGLAALMSCPPGVSGWHGPYLEQGVPDDPWTNPYVYGCPGKHNKDSFDLYSRGASGQDGGADNIDNWTIKKAGN